MGSSNLQQLPMFRRSPSLDSLPSFHSCCSTTSPTNTPGQSTSVSTRYMNVPFYYVNSPTRSSVYSAPEYDDAKEVVSQKNTPYSSAPSSPFSGRTTSLQGFSVAHDGSSVNGIIDVKNCEYPISSK